MPSRPTRPSPPPSDDVAHLVAEVEILVNHRLFDQAIAAIRDFARSFAEAEHIRDSTPPLEWSVEVLHLRSDIEQRLKDGGYIQIGQCVEATDEAIVERCGITIGHITTIRSRIAMILRLR